MTKTMTLLDAVTYAAALHASQCDQAGQPYIGHCVRVMLRLPADATEDEKVAALLHDSVEDCGIDARHLVAAGVSLMAVWHIFSVTKRFGEPTYAGFIAKIKASGESAVRIKLADIEDNMDPARLAALPPETAERLRKKYESARAILLGVEST